MSTDTLSTFFALLSLLCVAAVLLVVLGAVARRLGLGGSVGDELRAGLGRAALPLAWVVALSATLGSLYYSEVANYTPCLYCWYQRICMYPLAVILGVALLRRDVGVRWYALPLAIVGIGFSTYHVWIQTFPDSSSGACGVGASCTARYVEEFGFIAIPNMAWAAFALIITMLIVALPSDRTSAEPSAAVPETSEV